jgi:putative membrane protein
MTLPLTIVTLGLFLLVINAAMFGLVAAMLDGFSEEARTHGFASLTLVRFAFIRTIMAASESGSILGCT